MICYCKQVTEREIKDAMAKGAKTLKDIQEATEASTGNKCSELNSTGDINALLKASDSPATCFCCS